MRTLLGGFVVVLALALPSGALADKPVVTTQHVDMSIPIPAGTLCGFDVVFTEVGDLTVTTFSDGSQLYQGILQHTITGPGGTLSSIGPAPVHFDVHTGVVTDTGMEFSFHVPGLGVVLAQAGNFSFLPDGTVVALGLNRFSSALCEVLA
ncbi:MAG TPA: hypothetical protein VFK62_01440 [Gaiellaceae bacterium]|nr:hypothetical protein [Gaiellaceae bacterium]